MKIDYQFKEISGELHVHMEIIYGFWRMKIEMKCPDLRISFLADFPCLTSCPQEFIFLNVFVINVHKRIPDWCTIYNDAHIWKFIFDGTIIKILHNDDIVVSISDIDAFCDKLLETIMRIQDAINFTNSEISQTNTAAMS